MEPVTSPKKLKSPNQDPLIGSKTSVTCTNVPEGLFDATAAKKHFSKFGRVQKIRLFPKKHMCIIEYEQPSSAQRAVLNAGAYDGFMFDVTRTKLRTRRHSKKDDDPDWVPDSDVEEELSAMSSTPIYRITRQKSMDTDSVENKPKQVIKSTKSTTITRVVKQATPLRKILEKVPREKKTIVSQVPSGIESPVLVPVTQTSFTTFEAAAELHQLRFKVSLTPDEQWRTLDARDRILRAWGGAGSRVKIGGATIGTCQDMCPEKERLHRQAEHQVMTLETVVDSDGQLEPWRAVKQYSRSSADQEIPMCYELRPATALARTCAYLLHEIADTQRQVTLADWFHFMWDRLRGIRKDITQQALCCAESISLVEMCARFHAHCAARLADLEHTQFDQKLNTDNLTKCLQTLKHMYADVSPEHKPHEAEFRGYIALLNLGDANFWWEIKQLPETIQKSNDILFAIQTFNALDNNNYVRFFRLVKEKANYLQACILLRYFNDVRARALARIVKAYAPRGGSRFPAEDLMNALAFESIESMKSFINHYGLRCGKTDDTEISVILDRNQFIEDSDPYPIARAVQLIESKRQSSVGKVIAGGQLPKLDYESLNLYSSFNKDGTLKAPALIAEDQGYNTLNDSDKNVQALKAELYNLLQDGTSEIDGKVLIRKGSFYAKPETKALNPLKQTNIIGNIKKEYKGSETNVFAFKPAIPVASTEVIKKSPEKIFTGFKNIFTFSKPKESIESSLFFNKNTGNLFNSNSSTNLINVNQKTNDKNMRINENKDNSQFNQNPFKITKTDDNIFKKLEGVKPVFGHTENSDKNIFPSILNKNLFMKKDDGNATNQNTFDVKNVFCKPMDSNIFAKKENTAISGSIFAKSTEIQDSDAKLSANIFGINDKRNTFSGNNNLFSNIDGDKKSNHFFVGNGETISKNLSPGSLFKNACNQVSGLDSKNYSIFQSKNKAPSMADNIFHSVNTSKSDVYEFDQENEEIQKLQELQRLNEENLRKEEENRKEEQRKRELERQEQERRKEEEALRKQEELKKQEENRKKEEQRKQEELKRKLEEERKAELKRKAAEEDRKYKEKVEKESIELVEKLVDEVRNETVTEIMNEEVEKLKILMNYAEDVTEDIFLDVCNEICNSEIKVEIFRRQKLIKKYIIIWKKQLIRNLQRRSLLDDTPVWLTETTSLVEACYLRKTIEHAILKNMNAFHRGYKFTGELKQFPLPDPYNIMEIIRSPLLKRMKQIHYPYGKRFFWKITLVSPGSMKWLYRKINIENWLISAFSDKKKHLCDSLIHVGLQSWNDLMDFVISVSLTNNETRNILGEAIEGTNGILFYVNEAECDFAENIERTLQQKHLYQKVPVAVLIPQIEEPLDLKRLEAVLSNLKDKNVITDFRVFVLEHQNIAESMKTLTRNALKWLAKMYPQNPPLEIDYLKSLCQRYLGNEIWYKLKNETDNRVINVLKDLSKLINYYNMAVDKLIQVITNEDLFNYPSFPLEFREFLDQSSPYPKPYEFIPSNVKNCENILAIKNIMNQLKLPIPAINFQPKSVVSMQDNMRKYCQQIGWFPDPEKVVSKVVAYLPNEFSNLNMSCQQFDECYKHYDLIDFLNIMVYEKINRLKNFDNRYAIYEKSVLENYRNFDWIYEVEIISKMKHKACEYKDDIDVFLEAKRRKIARDSMEYLMLEDKDSNKVEQHIKIANESISKYTKCKETVKQLEDKIEEERMKSMELENLLKAALFNM